MEAASFRNGRRRLRRGSFDLPLNTRLVRVSSLVLVFPLMLVAFTLARPGPLPAPPLPSAFDGATATRLARQLATTAPRRVPGSLGAREAVAWYTEQLALYGLRVRNDAWSTEVPGLGRTELVNLVTIVPGRSDEIIALVAHRDNDGTTAGANDNASGTAALIELARAYGSSGGSSGRVRPLHTLAFVSTDGGAYGSLGALRIAREWRSTRRVVAVVTLDGLAGRSAPRLAVTGLGRRAAPPILTRTVGSRVAAGSAPQTTGWLAQLVSLGLGFAVGEQAAFIGEGIPAVGFGNAPLTPGARDEPAAISAGSMRRLGRAAEAAVLSLDEAIGLPSTTSTNLYLGNRAVRGWALSVLLLSVLVPFVIAVVDLWARLGRRDVAMGPAVSALRTRVGLWLFVVGVLFVAAAAGVFPDGPPVPPPLTDPAVTGWPVGALLAMAAAGAAAWLLTRTRLLPRGSTDPEDELAGQVVALAGVAVSAILIAIASPFALVLVVPSLVSWIWLPQLRTARGWVRDVLFAVGLGGPVAAVVVIGVILDLGARTPLYVASLVTTGVVPWVQTAGLAVWAAAAAQLGAIESRRYGPGRSSR